MLSSLPHDLLLLVVLAAEHADPLGPCTSYVALKNTNRALRVALDQDVVRAALCRLKFDTRTIDRRSFRPTTSDLSDQFTIMMRLIHALHRALASPDQTHLQIVEGRDDDTEDLLRTGWMMLLENDGKNYAQLDNAGFYTFLRRFVRLRLWEGRDENGGWPRDTPLNALAMMCMWMMTTQPRLDAESPAEKAELRTLIVPFVLCTPRYPSSEAPPNHFDLPLVPTHRPQQEPITLATADSPAAPKYPHYLPNDGPRVVNMYHWGAYIPISPPLCTIPARLLWIARQPPLGVPPHLPLAPGPGIEGMTQQHYMEFNRTPAAKLIAGPSWDWTSDTPVPLQSTSTLPSGTEGSQRWDAEFWRKVLCTDHTAPKPRFSPGEVYRYGSLHGTWRGRCYMPFGQHFATMLSNPIYPGIPDPDQDGLFTDYSLAPVPIPLCFEVEEHHRICGCPTVPTASADGTTFCFDGQGCGIIPIPPVVCHESPQVLSRFAAQELEGVARSDITLPENEFMEYGMSNSWFPGRLGHLNYVKRRQTVPVRPGDPIRDQVVFGFDLEKATSPLVNGTCGNLENTLSPCTPGSFRPDQDPIKTFPAPPPEGSGPFVYETYDPAKASTHDVMHSRRTRDDPECQTCRELEVQRVAERERLAAEARSALDQMLRDFVPPTSRTTDEANSRTEIQDLNLGSEDHDQGLSMLVDAMERQLAQSGTFDTRTRSPSPIPPTTKGKGKRAFDEMETDHTPSSPGPASRADSPSPSKHPRSSSHRPSSLGALSTSTLPVSIPQHRHNQQQQHPHRATNPGSGPSHPNDISVGIKLALQGRGSRLHFPGRNAFLAYQPGQRNAEEIAQMEAEVDRDEIKEETTAPLSSPAASVQIERSPSPVDMTTASAATPSPWFSVSDADSPAFTFRSFYADRPLPRQPTVFGDDIPNATDKMYVCVNPGHADSSRSPSPVSEGDMDVDDQGRFSWSSNRSKGECEGGCKFVLQDAERPVFDRHRVGVDCKGVKDVVFTGQTEASYAAADWKSTLYGRVRPWDGLIGMLRTAVTMNGQPQFFFVFGYIVGEETFVGEWRFAATQPWRPTWSGPFVMSKISNSVSSKGSFRGIPGNPQTS